MQQEYIRPGHEHLESDPAGAASSIGDGSRAGTGSVARQGGQTRWPVAAASHGIAGKQQAAPGLRGRTRISSDRATMSWKGRWSPSAQRVERPHALRVDGLWKRRISGNGGRCGRCPRPFRLTCSPSFGVPATAVIARQIPGGHLEQN